jgi:iron-sulfur cluster repair protein YtfE (RIC family)
MVLVIKRYKRRNGVIQLGSGAGASIPEASDEITRHFSTHNVNRYDSQNVNITTAHKQYREEIKLLQMSINHKKKLTKIHKTDKEYVDELNQDISALREKLRKKQNEERRIFS